MYYNIVYLQSARYEITNIGASINLMTAEMGNHGWHRSDVLFTLDSGDVYLCDITLFPIFVLHKVNLFEVRTNE